MYFGLNFITWNFGQPTAKIERVMAKKPLKFCLKFLNFLGKILSGFSAITRSISAVGWPKFQEMLFRPNYKYFYFIRNALTSKFRKNFSISPKLKRTKFWNFQNFKILGPWTPKTYGLFHYLFFRLNSVIDAQWKVRFQKIFISIWISLRLASFPPSLGVSNF